MSTHVTSFHEFLAEQPPGAFDRFVLLDAQDWMRPDQIASLWAGIARVGPPGSRVIFRTAARRSPIEEALPEALMTRFTYEEARFPGGCTHRTARPSTEASTFIRSTADPSWTPAPNLALDRPRPCAMSTAARMDDNYRWQRHVYDLTRRYYLFGRDRLLRQLAPQPGECILEAGCGTARNLLLLAAA